MGNWAHGHVHAQAWAMCYALVLCMCYAWDMGLVCMVYAGLCFWCVGENPGVGSRGGLGFGGSETGAIRVGGRGFGGKESHPSPIPTYSGLFGVSLGGLGAVSGRLLMGLMRAFQGLESVIPGAAAGLLASRSPTKGVCFGRLLRGGAGKGSWPEGELSTHREQRVPHSGRGSDRGKGGGICLECQGPMWSLCMDEALAPEDMRRGWRMRVPYEAPNARTRRPRVSVDEAEMMRRMFVDEAVSIDLIGRVFACSNGTVKEILRRAGVLARKTPVHLRG